MIVSITNCVRCGVAGVLALTCALATGQVYKSTDPSGRPVYSDQPPPGAKPTTKPAGGFAELAGRWTVANVTMDGVLRHDPEMSGASWTFQGSELTIESAKASQRFTLKPEPGAQPKAFHVTPVPPAREKPGWMIYARDGEKLRVAFHDNLERRPESFESRPSHRHAAPHTRGRAGRLRPRARAPRPGRSLESAG